MSDKYFRTPHLPYSPGGTNEDKRLKNDSHFQGESVVITEKMDGSNVCLTRDAVFARSHSAPPKHPSFDMLKAFHAATWFDRNVSYFGEWCYAKHSILYRDLPAHFLLFAVRLDDEKRWLSWAEVLQLAEYHDFSTVPILWEGKLRRNLEAMIEDLLLSHPQGKCGADPEMEGVVVRKSGGFMTNEVGHNIAKYVRKDHVQTDDHWKVLSIVKNKVRKTSV